MNQQISTINEKDPILWELANKRAAFKRHFIVYLLVNILLWALWFFTNSGDFNNKRNFNTPWPIWPTLGWGIGLAVQYLGAYVSPNVMSAENEYQKLKSKEKR